MNKEIILDPEIKAMFELLAEDASTMEACMAKIKRSLSIAAELFHINKVELKLEAPGSKLCPEGQRAVEILYDTGDVSDSEPNISVFPLPSGGTVTIMDYPRDQSKFSSKELELHNMLLRQIFYKISRTMTQNLLQQVMMTDMSTGVANQDYLMHFAGGLIASGQIANYNIIFFNVHNFKYVNKVFSYEQGDIILRNYAQHIKNIMGNDEIVARLEKGRTKINGAYWDKIQKANGNVGYAPRETFDYETDYKLYLVPVEQDNGGNKPEDSQEIVQNDKVKVDKSSKKVTAVPNATGNDFANLIGGNVAVKNSNGQVINLSDKLATGYTINDTYTVAVLGDVNGDGESDAIDLLLIKRRLLGTQEFDELKGNAADLNKDGVVDAIDLLLQKRYLLGTQNINI